MKMSKNKLLQIIKEEMAKEDDLVINKIKDYQERLRLHKEERANLFLKESDDSGNRQSELLGELKLLEQVIEDLEEIIEK